METGMIALLTSPQDHLSVLPGGGGTGRPLPADEENT